MKIISTITYTSIIASILLIGCGGGNGSTGGNTQSSGIQFSSSASKSITENKKQVFSIDVQNTGNIEFKIVGGADAALFTIDPQSGSLSFKTAPDFENPADSNHDNTYELIVEAEDIQTGKQATQSLTIKVIDDPSDDIGPEFISPDSKTIQENKLLDFKVQAKDAVSYTITGGDDQKLFKIDSTTGKLQFLDFVPNFEKSSDKNHDDHYEVVVTATDSAGHASSQHITIIVENDPSDDPQPGKQRFVFKTGQDDGVVPGLPFGDDRNFSLETTANGKRIVQVGKRYWEDAPENKNNTYTYDEAEQYCANLTTGGRNWRVPIRLELDEIINFGNIDSTKPTIDDIFINASKGDYWTSQKVLGKDRQPIDNSAFVISFRNAFTFPEKLDKKLYVRCVSGPEITDSDIETKREGETVVDITTDLQWAKPSSDLNWTTAKSRCENLVFEGHDDWRLPNLNELHTIMPVYYEEFLIETTPGDALRGPYWSTTTIDNNTAFYVSNYWNSAWTYAEGRDVLKDSTEPKTATNSAKSICVRGGHH